MGRSLPLPAMALLLLGLLSAAYHVAQLPTDTLSLQPMSEAQVTDSLIGGDFRLFWAQGYLASRGQAEQVYTPQAIAAQAPVAVFEGKAEVRASLYPPVTLLLLEPFGRIDFTQAWRLFSWGSLILLTLAVLLILPRAPWGLALVVGFGPVRLALEFGQNSLVLTALYLLFMASAARHMLPAGLALGLACFKPHLGVLAPVVLLLRRQFGVFLIAALVVAALIALSWQRYGEVTWLAYQQSFMAPIERLSGFEHISSTHMVSMYAGLRSLGLLFLPAMIGHGALALAGLICLWCVCRKTTDLWLPGAALVTAGLLVTPHLYSYDLVLLLVPLLALARYCQRHAWQTADIVIFGLLYIVPGFPALVQQQLQLPVLPVLVLALLVRLAILSEKQIEHED
jgi:hypothetical protein